MGRLIDTDDLIMYLGFANIKEEREENIGEIITLEMIDRIPTAYDLDEVLKQLEEEKNPMYRGDGTLMGARIGMSIDKAIEIVKNGRMVEDEKL